MRDFGNTEIGGFGVTPNNLLLVEDFITVPQICTSVTVELDDEALAKFFDGMAAKGLHPRQYLRVWIHTHPGNSATPSPTDEEMFAEKFKADCSHAIMLIVAKGGDVTCRLFVADPGIETEIPVKIDYQPSKDEKEEWGAEYKRNVSAKYTYSGYTPYAGYPQTRYYQGGAVTSEKKSIQRGRGGARDAFDDEWDNQAAEQAAEDAYWEARQKWLRNQADAVIDGYDPDIQGYVPIDEDIAGYARIQREEKDASDF